MEKREKEDQLIIANKELLFQKKEIKKLSSELIVAHKAIDFQNEEKEKRDLALAASTTVDINERKKDEEYVGHLAAIVESSDDAIISKSLDGTIKSWNKAGEKMFGYTSKEIVGKHISLIIPVEYMNEEKKILERICNNEITDHYETVRKKKNGEQFYVSLTVSPLKDRTGNIIGICKIARDITSRKKSEADLICANKELLFQNEEKEDRAAELIIANKELAFQNEEKEKRAVELIVANKELEQLTYIASHDLQEPLRTISNYMQVFEEDYLGQLDDNAHKYIRSISAASNRMRILIQALLDFSRLGRDKKLVTVDCNHLIADVMADLHTVIKNSDAIIEVSEMPILNIYEVEIGQLFQNLIINAIKFQKEGIQPQIQICSKNVNGIWQFSIRDNGIGVEPAYFQRVFDIFQRLHIGDQYQGYGIGLANCKKIVDLHHGKIWIESTLGNGTTVNFTISNL
ncbi:MAG: hypothetical protein JWO58_20 [Chitinophagaceae bacterium]|nr:hypothetical protein [Chitinophagaceae bacterium]